METHPKQPDEITPEWLTYVLKRAGLIGESSVESIGIEVIADGKAWLSNIVRLEVEYDSNNASAPNSFVLKLLSESRVNRNFDYELGAYEREISFYKDGAKNLPIRLPELFCSESGYSSNYMLMEDLSHLSAGDQIDGLIHEQVHTTLDALARIHAAYWGSPHLDSYNWMPDSNNIDCDYAVMWDSFLELCGDFIDPDGLRIGAQLRNHIPWLSETISDRPKTLVHDDMKADNLLFGEKGSDNAVVILDWQFVIRSMGAIDVARLIGGSWHPAKRQGLQIEALKHWHKKLLEYGVAEYSWDEAQRDFRLGALYCLTFPVHFHKGITRAQGRALEYIKTLYGGLFLLAVEIDADSILP